MRAVGGASLTPLEVIGDVLSQHDLRGARRELIAGDFSQIESRMLSMLAGEQWKLDAFREYDRTGDPRSTCIARPRPASWGAR